MTAGAFNEQVCVHLDAMYRVALAICGNIDDASDAVQNAAIKLWNNCDTLANVANMKAYCVVAARSAAITLMRTRRLCDSIDSATLLVGDSSPEHDIETADTAACIRSLIGTLPENQRIVLSMRDLEECEFDEIERATGLSSGNIRVLLSRARAAIRKHFSK